MIALLCYLNYNISSTEQLDTALFLVAYWKGSGPIWPNLKDASPSCRMCLNGFSIFSA